MLTLVNVFVFELMFSDEHVLILEYAFMLIMDK